MDVIFYNPKIEKELLALEKLSVSKLTRLTDLLERFGQKLGMPYSKQIHTNLYELRIRGKQEIRVFYCYYQKQACIVHYFIKKTQKTPRKEIETALKRVESLTQI